MRLICLYPKDKKCLIRKNTFKFLSFRDWEKKQVFPFQTKKSLQPRIEHGFKYINGYLTTTLPRQYDRNRKKFNYTNTI